MAVLQYAVENDNDSEKILRISGDMDCFYNLKFRYCAFRFKNLGINEPRYSCDLNNGRRT
jgi:hypothetical protein